MKNKLGQQTKLYLAMKLEPKTYLSINKKLYNAINPGKALEIAKQLTKGVGIYKVHVIYGKERISQRKSIVIENVGEFTKAREARQAIQAFLDKSLWIEGNI